MLIVFVVVVVFSVASFTENKSLKKLIMISRKRIETLIIFNLIMHKKKLKWNSIE